MKKKAQWKKEEDREGCLLFGLMGGLGCLGLVVYICVVCAMIAALIFGVASILEWTGLWDIPNFTAPFS